MDKSEVYIKMCDKSGLKEACSYAVLTLPGKTRFIGNDVFVELDRNTSTWRTIRLLRQNQIQEMMGKTSSAYCIYRLNDKWGGEIYQDREQVFTVEMESPEQLWLCFFMWERHQKIWDGNQWIKKGE